MTEMKLDPRAVTWLDLGPNRAPADSFDAIMAGVDAVPQRRSRLWLGGRPVAFTPRLLAAAAAIVVVASAVGGFALRDPILDVLAPPPGDLLGAFPETRSILDATGGPSAQDETVVAGRLPKDEAFVISATCTGGGSMPVEVWDRGIEYGPDVSEADKQPNRRLDVPCDGSIATTRYVTDPFTSDNVELTAAVPAGATWRIAVGQVRSHLDEPQFPALEVTEDTALMVDVGPQLAFSRPGLGIVLQPPPAGTMVAVLVQCLGDPVTVTSETGMEPVQLACTDVGTTTRIDMPGSGQAVRAGTDGFAWVRMAVEAPTGPSAARPSAPPMPAELAGVAFAEGDGQNVAFGTLGSSSQQLVRVADSLVGQAGGDVVGISRLDGDNAVLELWSLSDAAMLRTLATVRGGRIFGSWVDQTHEQVFYGVQDRIGTFEWRRVGFDGAGETVVASGPIGVRFAQAAMAVDDAQFVAEWCPLLGSCERTVFEAASGEAQRIVLESDPICSIVGVLDGRFVATTPACDAGVEQGRVLAQAVDGGAWTTLIDDWADATLIVGSEGPQAVVLRDDETRTILSTVALDGTGLREIAAVDHEQGMGPRLSTTRLPDGDWILLAGSIGDLPGSDSSGGMGPQLLNVVTGEWIELVNLPGF